MEKFTSFDLVSLSNSLMQIELDAVQASEILASFLNGRGYGADAQTVQEAAIRMDNGYCEPEHMQAELERLALVM